jgi:hypothetical protein
MRLLTRALALGAVAAVMLAVAESALATLTPQLYVGSGIKAGTSTLTIDAKLGTTDDWLGRLQVYVPSGFKLNAPPGGVQVGTAQVQAFGTQVGPGQAFAMPGAVKAVGATDPAVAAQTASCDNTTHLAAWMVSVIGGDDSWSFPIFVDQTTGNETTIGPYKLVVCFGPRDVGSTNPYGNKFISMSLSLGGFAAPKTAGNYRWHGLWTPFAGQSGSTLDQAATVESQSVLQIATGGLTIAAKRAGKHVVLSGKLVVGGTPLNGVKVHVVHGPARTALGGLGSASSNGSGVWALKTLVKKPSFFQAGATIGKRDLGPSACTSAFGVPCLDATAGATRVVSGLIRVSP